MNPRNRFLLCLWDGGGNVPPLLSVARSLVERGHDVRALADTVLHNEVRAAGVTPVAWTLAPQRSSAAPTDVLVRDWEARTPVGMFRRVRDGLLTGPSARFAADVVADLAARRADVVIADPFPLGVQVGAEAAGVPFAALVPNPIALPGWGVPPTGPGLAPARGPAGRARDAVVGRVTSRLFDGGLATLNATRAAYGLAPVDHVIDQLVGGERVLVLTSPGFELPGYAPPPHVEIVGPRLDDPGWAGDWSPPPGDAPLVLVSLSSTFMDQSAVLGRVASALGDLPVRGLVTTGPCCDPEQVAAPANVTVVRSAPHAEVLRHAAAMVTHAGHGTTIKALAAGVPVLALPMGRDQPDNATRVVWHGAGLKLRPSASPAKIAAAVRRLLDDPAFADGARRQAQAIAACTREDRAVAALEDLARARSDAGDAVVA
jgi:MGT family glycosyltransferase